MRNIQPGKANFDLGHLAGLSDAPSLLLVVSERTLYLLENLSALDVGDMWRYAVDYAEQQYQPLTESDSEFNLYEDVRDLAQLEILEVGTLTDIYGIVDTTREWGAYQFPSAGNAFVVIGTVPEGEKWQVEAVSVRNINSVCTLIALYVKKGTARVDLAAWDNPAMGRYHSWVGRVSLAEGDQIEALFFGCAANDNVDGVMWAAVLA